ncbi:MAG: ImmA/IrrE family metallo-endopeptidase [Rhodobacteraceae bacterium]|nr:ImmA/IrrE family metallo-endopeptidase [Paracoccaceae bacterium]
MIFTDKMDIIRRHQEVPPVNVLAIADDLGIKVYATKDNAWPQSVSGWIRKSGPKESGFEIVVNGDHSLLRQRFTIAHEIAHFVLHENQIGDGIQDDVLYRSGLSTKIESEANSFAADILMPWHLVDREIATGETDIKNLAMTFRVSPASMSIRLGVPYDS